MAMLKLRLGLARPRRSGPRDEIHESSKDNKPVQDVKTKKGCQQIGADIKIVNLRGDKVIISVHKIRGDEVQNRAGMEQKKKRPTFPSEPDLSLGLLPMMPLIIYLLDETEGETCMTIPVDTVVSSCQCLSLKIGLYQLVMNSERNIPFTISLHTLANMDLLNYLTGP